MPTPEFILQLVQTLIWPSFGVFLVLALRKQLAAVLQGSSVTSVELPGGLKIGLEARLASAAAAGVAIGRQGKDDAERSTAASVQSIAEALSNEVSGQHAHSRRSILWVDDIPENNTYLVDSFRKLGYSVVEARSTDEAMKVIRQNNFDIVISDMGRPPDGQAGLTLVSEMKAREIHLPVIIFAANWARAHAGQESKFGLAKITNDAAVVYSAVVGFMSGNPLNTI